MPTQNEKASKRSCLFLSILFFVVLPFSSIALGLLLWSARESSGNRRLAARKANMVKQGLPIDDKTMTQFFNDRTDPTNLAAWQNVLATIADKEYQASRNEVATFWEDMIFREPIVPDIPWEDEAASLSFLDKWKTLHEEVVQLSIDAKPVRFHTQFNSTNTLLPEVQSLMPIARTLELQGRVGLRARNSAVVRENLEALLGLSNIPTGYPSLVSQFVSFAIDGIAMDLLKDAIEFDVLSEVDLQILLPKVLEVSDFGEDWKATIAVERGIALPMFSNPEKGKSVGVTSLPGRSYDALLYLDLMEGLIDIPLEDLAEFKARLQNVESRVQEIANANLLAKFDSIITLQTIPSMQGVGEAFIRRALMHRMAALAIGLRLYEDRNGSLPKSIQVLSEISLDIKRLTPTNGTSFGYRVDRDNAKLWGGSNKDTLKIASEPHTIESMRAESLESSRRENWLWELPAGRK